MITELAIGDISVDVVFKDIKNVHLSVYPPTGRVRISAPARMSMESVRLFAISKIGWIKKQQVKLRKQEREPPREYIDRESHYIWGQRFLLQVTEDGDQPGVIQEHRRLVLCVEPQASHDRRRELLDDWYRRELRDAAKPLIAKWEQRLEQSVDRFFVQRMKTKWGSSNPRRGIIRLNLELAKKRPECLDYVVLHEIAHFVVADHSPRFTTLLDSHLPQWRVVRQELNLAPLSDEAWLH